VHDLLEFFSGVFTQSGQTPLAIKSALNAFGLIYTTAPMSLASSAFEK
jgi:hypothetical protein